MRTPYDSPDIQDVMYSIDSRSQK